MEDDENSNVGFRFHPKDYELVDYFLRHKMLGNDFKVTRIGELNITDFEPWDLPAKSVIQSDDQEWYFFCPRKNKYSTGSRSQRNTRTGQWKITGKERKVKKRGTSVVIGTKRTLVFYEGRSRSGSAPRRTSWVMHEFSPINTHDSRLKPYVLCRVKKKADENADSAHAEPEMRSYADELSHTTVASITPNNPVEEYLIPEIYDHQAPEIESLFDQPQGVDFSDLQLLMLEEPGPSNEEFNDYNGPQFLSGASDEEDVTEFLNIPDDSSQGESLMREDVEYNLLGSDRDAEAFRPRYLEILDGLYNEIAASKEHQSRPTMRAAFSSDSSKGPNRGKNVSRYQFKGPTASSAADHYNSIVKEEEQPIPPSHGFINIITAPPKVAVSLNRFSVSRRQGFSRGKESAAESSNAGYVLKRSSSALISDIDSQLQRIQDEQNLELRSNRPGKSNGKSSFIVMEAPFLVHKATSPSVHFVNAVVGAVLFLVMVWELVSMGGC